jgi:RNA polymerase sigma-70 factor (sigma-E family)
VAVVVSAEEAFSWFFREEYPGVLRLATLVVQDKGLAEDVTQDAFAQLYRHWTRVSRYDRPDAWVRKVAVRLAVKAVRRARLSTLVSPEDRPILDSYSDPDLIRAIAELPAGQRAAIVLFYLEDRPVEDVATIMELSGATVKVHLHRGRKKLAQLLGEEVSPVVA